MGDFSGQTAIVTGAAQGIGRAIAAALVERGAKGQIFVQRVDLSKAEEISSFVAAVEKRFSGVDILVNNAGKAVLPGMRKRRYGRIINISSEAGKNGGTLAAAHYCASKGGVLAFTRNLAQQVGADGITVNAICPGRIATEMSGAVSPEENQRFIDKSIIKRLGRPEDIAFAICSLADRRADFVTAETMNVNGGTLRD